MLSHLVTKSWLLEFLACSLDNQPLLVHILLTESSAARASLLPMVLREPQLRGHLGMHLEVERLYLLKLSTIL
jgi:hypothetical protein